MAIVTPVKANLTSGVATSLAEFGPTDQIAANIVAGLMGRNMLINCGVPINQRGFGGGVLAAGVYGYDRWKAGTGGCNLTINATTGVWTHVSGPVQQVIESPEGAWGVPITVSVDSPSVDLNILLGGSSGTITAGSGRRSVTLIPSGSGNMTFQITPTASSTYSRIQIERGSSATDDEYRNKTLELTLCQRFYEKSYSLGVSPGTITPQGQLLYQITGLTPATNSFLTRVSFQVSKRAQPAITAYNPSTGAAGTARDAISTADVVPTVANAGSSGFIWGAASSAVTAVISINMHFTADAEL